GLRERAGSAGAERDLPEIDGAGRGRHLEQAARLRDDERRAPELGGKDRVLPAQRRDRMLDPSAEPRSAIEVTASPSPARTPPAAPRSPRTNRIRHASSLVPRRPAISANGRPSS